MQGITCHEKDQKQNHFQSHKYPKLPFIDSIRLISLSIMLNIFSTFSYLLARILNPFQAQISSRPERVSVSPCAKNRADFFTANFSIGRLLPAMRCFRPGMVLREKECIRLAYNKTLQVLLPFLNCKDCFLLTSWFLPVLVSLLVSAHPSSYTCNSTFGRHTLLWTTCSPEEVCLRNLVLLWKQNQCLNQLLFHKFIRLTLRQNFIVSLKE